MFKLNVSVNRSGKQSESAVPSNPRAGSSDPAAPVYPGYVVLLDEDRLVMGPDSFLQASPRRLTVGLFVLPVEPAGSNVYRISYMGRICSISDAFSVEGVAESVRTVRFSPVCKAGMGPNNGRFVVESVMAWNVRVMDMQEHLADAMLFRPSYDLAVPDVSIASESESAYITRFDAGFDVAQEWTFSLAVGGGPDMGTANRTSSGVSEMIYAMVWAGSPVNLKGNGQGSDNIFNPLIEMTNTDGGESYPWRCVASFTFPAVGNVEDIEEGMELRHVYHFYWLAWYKLPNSMSIQTRFAEHGKDNNIVTALDLASAISPTFSMSQTSTGA